MYEEAEQRIPFPHERGKNRVGVTHASDLPLTYLCNGFQMSEWSECIMITKLGAPDPLHPSAALLIHTSFHFFLLNYSHSSYITSLFHPFTLLNLLKSCHHSFPLCTKVNCYTVHKKCTATVESLVYHACTRPSQHIPPQLKPAQFSHASPTRIIPAKLSAPLPNHVKSS